MSYAILKYLLTKPGTRVIVIQLQWERYVIWD